ncbi:phage minor head protein [Jiella avicenniae]|uniref:Phage head morphogenesis protein n=1 Tax=Jiella avicenniae TaxID=2907202 RepID=A0A9X1NZP9_9HYPH|nr:phage minor head protein [Jiella avicenniae]MCE7028472.1 phage head morphogenesis protein [Jiella avicenniae]
MASQREIIAGLVARYEPQVRQAFLDAISDVRDAITLRIVIDRLERNDINGAVEALHLDHEAFARLEQSITDAYTGGGQAIVQTLPKLRDPGGDLLIWRFGVRNTQGELELRRSLEVLSTNLTTEAREVARTKLVEGLAAGRNPTQTAVELVGRVNRASGKREGGIIGLSRPQAQYVQNARDELQSGDPKRLRNYLTRGQRDKRFDRAIEKAIREGKPLPQDLVSKIAGRYSDGLLKLRGDTIALDQTMTAMARAKDESYRQQIASGKVDQRFVTKTWHHSPEEDPRLNHLALDGKTVGYNEMFDMGNGTMMRYAHDPEGGPKENLFCKCRTEYRFSAVDALVSRMGRA